MSDDAVSAPTSGVQRRALAIAFLLNLGLAASLGIAGTFADSSALIANGLDNFSDATVYAISYYAVARGARWKIRAAQFSGVMLLVLCLGVLADVARRLFVGVEPVSNIIIAMSIVSAIINVLSLRLLRPLRGAGVNLRAAWTFSLNDLVSNLGVLAAGLLVAWSGRSWPDLAVGLAIALVAAKGGIEILADARRSARTP